MMIAILHVFAVYLLYLLKINNFSSPLYGALKCVSLELRFFIYPLMFLRAV